MKATLLLLEELQRHDARLLELDTELAALPEKLAVLKRDVGRMEELLGAERRGLVEAETYRRSRELDLKSDEANVAKAKTKLQQVKNAREYMAAQRETEVTRRLISEREEEIIKLIDAIEASRKSLATHTDDLAALHAHVAGDEKEILARLDELRAIAEGERVHRNVVAARVPDNVMKRYGAIKLRRGLAVVAVKGGTCQGCHMAIPPQLRISLQRSTSIETCPTCNRIIYSDSLLTESALERGEREPGGPTATE